MISKFENLMKKVRPLILDIYNKDFEVEYKGDNSPLTEADTLTNKEIVSFLEENFKYPILSEEGKSIDYAERSKWDTFWLVDPIDGTKEFVKKNGEFTVNIALIENSKPIFGVIYVPVTDTLYYGDTNSSFKVNNLTGDKEKLSLPYTRTNTLTFVASNSHRSAETDKFISSFKDDKKIVSIGSSLKLCLVAEGSADIYPRLAPTMEWDIAAGHAILLGAGKQLVEFNSGLSFTYNKPNLVNTHFKAL